MLWLGVLLLGFGFGLGLLVSWPSLSESAEATSDAGVEYDISGIGTCSGSRIQVDSLWLWTQSPTPLNVMHVAPSDFNDALNLFKGKNAVVWGGTVDLAGFTYDTVDGDTIVANEAVSTTGPTECHFTIDAIDTIIYADADSADNYYMYHQIAAQYQGTRYRILLFSNACYEGCKQGEQCLKGCSAAFPAIPIANRSAPWNTTCILGATCVKYSKCGCLDYPYGVTYIQYEFS